MKQIILVLIGLLPFFGIQAQITGVTEYGDEILLYDDGTWEYMDTGEEVLECLPPFVMAQPPVQEKTGNSTMENTLKLVLKSSAANEITDDDVWLEKNQLETRTYEVPNPFMRLEGNLPEDVPTHYQEHMLVRAIHAEDYLFLIYGNDFSEGRFLVVMDNTSRVCVHAFDFASYESSPEITPGAEAYVRQRIEWATIEGTTLYVSHSHSTYAESSKGMNAYITAIDLKTTDVIWRSRPLTCNTTNFVLMDNAVVCGYGFTDEKDYIYVLNKHNGKINQTVPVKSGPSWLIRKNNELFVRTYNTDYVFTITP